jgi:hypothetical protein
MNIFSSGIILTANENACLLHMVPDAEIWVTSTISEKITLRRDALINEWRPRLYADESVTELPAESSALVTLIMARSDYKTRLQQDAEITPAETGVSRTPKDKYASVTRSGSTVTLFSSGINLADTDANCILAYVQDIEEWVIGALMGQVNRGKKKMIAQYHPIIMSDASVTTMPATEDGLITMILARSDYQRLGS